MVAEYVRADRICFFDLPDGEPPQTVTLSARACPKSPPIRIDLEYVAMRQDVAVYRIITPPTEEKLT